MLLSDDKTILIEVTPEDIKEGHFIIPQSVESIGDCAFRGCASLIQVTIPQSVTSIGESAFKGCTRLIQVTIPQSVTSIGESTFEGCTRLTQVTISQSVKNIGSYAFSGCTHLAQVTIPQSVESIGFCAFLGCTRLTQVTISQGMKSIGECAFRGCASLTHVIIAQSVTSIGAGAFKGCTSLTQVVIPQSVIRIERYTFFDCTRLIQVTIPQSVESIGKYAFYNYTKLHMITVDSDNEVELERIRNLLPEALQSKVIGKTLSKKIMDAQKHAYTTVLLPSAGVIAFYGSIRAFPQLPDDLILTTLDINGTLLDLFNSSLYKVELPKNESELSEYADKLTILAESLSQSLLVAKRLFSYVDLLEKLKKQKASSSHGFFEKNPDIQDSIKRKEVFLMRAVGFILAGEPVSFSGEEMEPVAQSKIINNELKKLEGGSMIRCFVVK